MGLLGEFRHAVDEKGRLTLPSRLREELGQPFVVTKGLDRCLFLYPVEEWGALEQRLRQLPLGQADARAFQRLFFAGAAECRCDAQGRVLIPAAHREYARLERDVVVVGVSTRAELWSADEWDRYADRAEESYEAIAERLTGLDV
jgi:MraZ protein